MRTIQHSAMPGKTNFKKRLQMIVSVKHSGRETVSDLSRSLAGFNVAVVESKGNELLKAGIDLLMHGRILGRDVGELLKQPGPAVVVVSLRILESLVVVSRSLLGSLERVGLGLGGTSALHGGGASDPSNSTLASARLLLLGRSSGRGSIRGAVPVRRGKVVHTSHVVEQIPPAGESVAGHRPVTTLKQAQVGVISVTVESMGFALVAEKACVRRELQLGIHAGGHLAAVGLQVGVQVFAVARLVSMLHQSAAGLTY